MAQQQSPQQLNAMARMLVQTQSIPMTQQIYSQSVNPANGNVVTINPRNVGLIMGFWLKVTATATNNDSGSAAATPTDFGAANLLSQITFTDLNNNVRIQTTGWHLAFLNSLKARKPYGAALVSTSDDGPVKYGANWTVSTIPATIAKSATGTVTYWYWVPLAYSDSDFRGAIYANVINATQQLQLTINNTPTAATGDTTAAIFTGSNSVALNPVTITVYQVYRDQIPMVNGMPILPQLDLGTIYELKQTAFTSMVVNQDFPMQYANFRDFLSTVVVYFNGTTRGVGADINYWALQAANFTNLFKMEPALSALRTRNHLHYDLPPGAYYFGSREKPISSVQYGNMELVLNPATAGAGTAYALVGYEDFAVVNVVSGAGSLPAS
jgi:hypothetical protein